MMQKNTPKPTVRLAIAALVAVLSVVGLAQATGAEGAVLADKGWCC